MSDQKDLDSDTSRLSTTAEPEGRLNIFVAHRQDDQKHVSAIIDRLRLFCGDKVEFFFAKDIPAGIHWRKWISDNIAISNHLWLFYTDPKARWEWPLYEAGVFAGLSESKRDTTRLICFHRDNGTIPDALADYQAVGLTPESIFTYLEEFFREKLPPNYSAINEQVVGDEETMLGIVDLFLALGIDEGPRVPTFQLYNKHLDIEFSFQGRVPEIGEVRSGRIESDSVVTDMFGLFRLPGTWDELIDILVQKTADNPGERETYERWINELHTAIESACQESVFEQPNTSFTGLDDGKVYLPVLHGMRMMKITEEGSTDAFAQVIFVKRDGHE